MLINANKFYLYFAIMVDYDAQTVVNSTPCSSGGVTCLGEIPHGGLCTLISLIISCLVWQNRWHSNVKWVLPPRTAPSQYISDEAFALLLAARKELWLLDWYLLIAKGSGSPQARSKASLFLSLTFPPSSTQRAGLYAHKEPKQFHAHSRYQ
jgi:hypothetical protein